MRSFNGDFPPWRCSGRQRRRGERRRHPLGNKPWKMELHHQDEPWRGCFNGRKEHKENEGSERGVWVWRRNERRRVCMWRSGEEKREDGWGGGGECVGKWERQRVGKGENSREVAKLNGEVE